MFSGGDTSFLIKSLKKENFAEKIQKQDNNIETIVGISAGAIVLFEKGIGTKNNEEYIFDGLGLLPGIIIVHSNDKLQKKYPRAIHLKDYELYKKRIKKTALSKRYS
ncbi:MAG: Type 1 glutamine amidotransferase-like domain-containing protein [Patescibacteria group bacterium]